MTYTKDALKEAIQQKLRLNYGCTEKQATDGEIMKACALALRDIMAVRSVDTQERTQEQQEKRVHYMSLEFLMGRSLMKNAYNLGILPQLTQAVEELGFSAPDIFDMEPDAGLGNGGLGRLAACYLDSMTTLDIPATGYSICYELGIFKQKIVDGQQVELPDDWLNLGDAWLMPKPQEAEEIHFGGRVRTRWDNGHLMVVHEDYTRVLAIPCDMLVAGYNTDHVNTLRLWDAKSPKPIDMQLFSQGQYLKANEERAMADSISTILYPEDNHYEGKSLRLKQQYFFVSATLQSITRRHIQTYGTLKNFHEKNVIQINDTHPALVIPELMRILIDDAGLGWDEAWDPPLRGLYQPHRAGRGTGELAPAAVRDAAAPHLADHAGDRAALAAEGGRFLSRPQKDGENGGHLGRRGAHGQPLHRRGHGRQRRVRPALRHSAAGRVPGRLRHGAGQVQKRHQRRGPPPLDQPDQPRPGRPDPGLHRRWVSHPRRVPVGPGPLRR